MRCTCPHSISEHNEDGCTYPDPARPNALAFCPCPFRATTLPAPAAELSRFDQLLAEGHDKHTAEAIIEEEACPHDDEEDCMNCVGCGRCREDLDCNDRCADCGGHDCETAHPGTDVELVAQ